MFVFLSKQINGHNDAIESCPAHSPVRCRPGQNGLIVFKSFSMAKNKQRRTKRHLQNQMEIFHLPVLRTLTLLSHNSNALCVTHLTLLLHFNHYFIAFLRNRIFSNLLLLTRPSSSPGFSELVHIQK